MVLFNHGQFSRERYRYELLAVNTGGRVEDSPLTWDLKGKTAISITSISGITCVLETTNKHLILWYAGVTLNLQGRELIMHIPSQIRVQ